MWKHQLVQPVLKEDLTSVQAMDFQFLQENSVEDSVEGFI